MKIVVPQVNPPFNSEASCESVVVRSPSVLVVVKIRHRPSWLRAFVSPLYRRRLAYISQNSKLLVVSLCLGGKNRYRRVVVSLW